MKQGFFSLFLFPWFLFAQNPNYSEDIAPICMINVYNVITPMV